MFSFDQLSELIIVLCVFCYSCSLQSSLLKQCRLIDKILSFMLKTFTSWRWWGSP